MKFISLIFILILSSTAYCLETENYRVNFNDTLNSVIDKIQQSYPLVPKNELIQQLKDLNDLQDINYIKYGQILIVPVLKASKNEFKELEKNIKPLKRKRKYIAEKRVEKIDFQLISGYARIDSETKALKSEILSNQILGMNFSYNIGKNSNIHFGFINTQYSIDQGEELKKASSSDFNLGLSKLIPFKYLDISFMGKLLQSHYLIKNTDGETTLKSLTHFGIDIGVQHAFNLTKNYILTPSLNIGYYSSGEIEGSSIEESFQQEISLRFSRVLESKDEVYFSTGYKLRNLDSETSKFTKKMIQVNIGYKFNF